jgi:radical SAM superfamily enzyme YgiQ (UPF0313 family)
MIRGMQKQKRALFVDLSEDIFDRQGIYALSASLRSAGVEAGYVSGRDRNSLVKRVMHLQPDIVLYSAFSHTLDSYREFDASLKMNCEIYSVIGGPGITFNHSFIDNTSIDAACVGEGDYALSDFIANSFNPGKNIYLRGGSFSGDMYPLADLDSLPFPDREGVYRYDSLRARQPSKQFVSGRGCPYLCAYCFNHRYNKMVKKHGAIIRKKSVNYLCEEIDSIKRRYPLSMVVFSDDTFILDKNWLHEFADRYPATINLPYSCNIRANLVTESTVRTLKESGCVAVNWSIETGDESYRNTVLKRNMTDEQILDTAALLQRYGIQHRIGNLIGLPGETLEQLQKTIELNIKAKANISIANIFVPYPGLDLTNYALKEGFCSKITENDLPKTTFSHSVMNLSPDMHHYLQRLVFTFPLYSRFPWLYFSKSLKGLVQRLPLLLLRLVHELYYGVMFRKMYRVKPEFKVSVQLFWRHLRSVTQKQ